MVVHPSPWGDMLLDIEGDTLVSARWINRTEGEFAPFPVKRIEPKGCSEFAAALFAALQRVPMGETVTYGQLAAMAGYPAKARGVGSALSTNVIALAVPCHRVVAANGPGGYKWGLERKKAILEWERKTIVESYLL